MTGESHLAHPSRPVDPYQAANLANAALHLDDRTLHLPLTTIVEHAQTSAENVRDWLREQAGPDFTPVWAEIDSGLSPSLPPSAGSGHSRETRFSQRDRHAP